MRVNRIPLYCLAARSLHSPRLRPGCFTPCYFNFIASVSVSLRFTVRLVPLRSLTIHWFFLHWISLLSLHFINFIQLQSINSFNPLQSTPIHGVSHCGRLFASSLLPSLGLISFHCCLADGIQWVVSPIQSLSLQWMNRSSCLTPLITVNSAFGLSFNPSSLTPAVSRAIHSLTFT